MKYGARIFIFILLVLAAAGWRPAQAAPTGKRVALVVGNSAYEHTTTLRNPVNDARDIAAVLGRLGFEVVAAYDANAERFTAAVEEFSRKMTGAQAALFYYAGHGVQFGGRNYLLPVDARLSSEFALKREAIAADDVIQPMESAERVNIVFLDSCRNNPLAEQLKRSVAAPTRAASVGRGLAPIEPSGRDTLIVFSTAPGEEAEDGGGRHSPFTDALLRHIETPGVDVEVMLKRVTGDVRKATGERQRPERLARLAKEFAFNPEDGGAAVVTRPAQEAPPQTAPPAARDEEQQLVYWNSIKDSRDPALFESYLKRYPNGIFIDIARAKIREYRSSGQAQPQPPTQPQDQPSRLGDRSGDGPAAPVGPTYRVASGVSEGVLNMRSGPGQDHRLVVSIPANSRGVAVESCRDPDDGRSRFKWCKARWRGYSGWLSSNGLVKE